MVIIMMTFTFRHALKLLSILLLLFFLPLTTHAADVNVKIDRGNIQLNETFTLTFEANDDVDDEPDFSPLEKDFQVLRKSTSSNISLINGNYTKTLRWTVSLMALSEGTVTIPSINFGSDKSAEYQITIKPVQKSTGGAGEEFISELDLSTTSTYPQSQLIVTQRMLSARNISGYEFSPLKFSGVDVVQEPLGEVKQYQANRAGTPYLVLEQSFVIYPQSAGDLKIQPSIATARVAMNSQSQFNTFRSNTKTVRRATETKLVTVKPVPSSFNGHHWLPAKEVQLVEEFPQGQTFNAGEPITRTLSLLADGQSASQLPEFPIKDITGLKQYPDKPLLNDNKSDDGITGIQQIKVAIIPSKAGSYTLPEITIPWWNTKTQQQEIAKIPARTFTVGNALSSNTQTPSVPDMTAENNKTQAPVIPLTETQTTGIEHSEIQQQTDSLTWKIISLLLAIGWIITLAALWNIKRQLRPAHIKPEWPEPSLKQSLEKIKRACESSDAQACKDALLIWGRLLYTDHGVYSLGQLSSLVNGTLKKEINELNSHLYKNTSDSWSCDNLYTLCEAFSSNHTQSTREKNSSEQLESLYQ